METNLLEETIEVILNNNYTSNDIAHITKKDGREVCDWDTFERLADFDYDNSYGQLYVDITLRITMKDGSYFTREEYDGSEWWRLNSPVVVHQDATPITTLLYNG